MIYVHEYQCQKTNPSNWQERYLHVPSWEVYVECLCSGHWGEWNCRPNVKAPGTFRIIEKNNEMVYGTFTMDKLPEEGFMHMSKIVRKENIPYSQYIIELELYK